jgi:hypothetical protein
MKAAFMRAVSAAMRTSAASASAKPPPHALQPVLDGCGHGDMRAGLAIGAGRDARQHFVALGIGIGLLLKEQLLALPGARLLVIDHPPDMGDALSGFELSAALSLGDVDGQ